MQRIMRLVGGAVAVVALAVLGVAVAVAGAALAGSSASPHTLRVVLTPGAETPRPKAPAGATGLFTGTVVENGASRTLTWKLTFSRLSGRAVAAHLHRGAPRSAGGVVTPLCGPCRPGQTGRARLTGDAWDALEDGLAYVNVHTAKNAAGEIRGQVKALRSGSTGGATGGGSTQTQPGITTDPGGGYGGY